MTYIELMIQLAMLMKERGIRVEADLKGNIHFEDIENPCYNGDINFRKFIYGHSHFVLLDTKFVLDFVDYLEEHIRSTLYYVTIVIDERERDKYSDGYYDSPFHY